MTSLKPINPDNAPDKFETAALIQFEQGVSEVSALEKNDGCFCILNLSKIGVDPRCFIQWYVDASVHRHPFPDENDFRKKASENIWE